MSVDVSREGLLFTSKHAGYWKGQRIDLTFPYSSDPGAMNQGRPADVVRVQEQPGKRFAIAVHFPVVKADGTTDLKSELASLPPGVSSTAGATSRKYQSVILAVEPDGDVADLMRSVLGKDGYTVIVVPTAKEAVEIMRTTVPSAFLAHEKVGTVALNVAGDEETSGHELSLLIKKDMRLRDVPVILFARDVKKDDYSASRHLGAVIRIATPFEPERLQQVVRLVAPPPLNSTPYGTRVGYVERSL